MKVNAIRGRISRRPTSRTRKARVPPVPVGWVTPGGLAPFPSSALVLGFLVNMGTGRGHAGDVVRSGFRRAFDGVARNERRTKMQSGGLYFRVPLCTCARVFSHWSQLQQRFLRGSGQELHFEDVIHRPGLAKRAAGTLGRAPKPCWLGKAAACVCVTSHGKPRTNG